MQRRDLMTGAAGLAAAPLAGPARAQQARLLRYSPHANLPNIDPFTNTAFIARDHAFLVFDQLYGMDEQFRPQPQMVEGHVVENDGLLWRFTLREGQKFHDGTPVRGRDCIASIRRWGARDAFGQALMARVASMAEESDRVFAIRLTRPFPKMLDAFAKVTTSCLFIMPERLGNVDPSTNITEAVGSGPYRFRRDEWVPGSRVVYERFADYAPRQEQPSHDRRRQGHPFRPRRMAHHARPRDRLGSPAGGRDRLVGAAHGRPLPAVHARCRRPQHRGGRDQQHRPHRHLPPQPPDRAVQQPRGAPRGADGGQPDGLHDRGDRRCRHPGRPNLRRENIGYFAPESPSASTVGLDKLKNSIAAARAELQAAGGMGARLLLMNATDLASINAASLVGADLFTRMGFNVDLASTDWGTMVARRARNTQLDQGGWSGFFTFWSGVDHWNPASHAAIRGHGAASWPGWPTIPAIEAQRDAWFDAPSEAAALAATTEMQRIAFDEVPYVPVGMYYQPTAYRRNLSGILKGQPPLFWNVKRG